MFTALNDNGEKILPDHGLEGKCPECGKKVWAKCGDPKIKKWHWYHVDGTDCDSWSEPEGPWHYRWKMWWPLDKQEVRLEKRTQSGLIIHHRADILAATGQVLELQASSINSKVIFDREQFYNDMFWIVHGDTFFKNFKTYEKDNHHTFRWKHPRKSWWNNTKPIIMDFFGQLFLIRKLYADIPCAGWGQRVEFAGMMDGLKNGYSTDEYLMHKHSRDAAYDEYMKKFIPA